MVSCMESHLRSGPIWLATWLYFPACLVWNMPSAAGWRLTTVNSSILASLLPPNWNICPFPREPFLRPRKPCLLSLKTVCVYLPVTHSGSCALKQLLFVMCESTLGKANTSLHEGGTKCPSEKIGIWTPKKSFRRNSPWLQSWTWTLSFQNGQRTNVCYLNHPFLVLIFLPWQLSRRVHTLKVCLEWICDSR